MIEFSHLRQLCYQTLLDLSTEDGINASSLDDVFGCIFGRDSAITILKILKVHNKTPLPDLLDISRKTLLTLVTLQGKEVNIESGEEPGKFIHEFRKDEKQLQRISTFENPWFIYPNGWLRNYDSIDSTPLILIALFRFWEATEDNEFIFSILPSIEYGLNWIITYGDKDKDLFLEYTLPPERKHGGLTVQSWTDSTESLLNTDNQIPPYPIAPIEVQGEAWLALRLWADFFKDHNPEFAKKLRKHAKDMKQRFNKVFILKDKGLYFGAQALDGYKNQIKTITANPMLLLWSSYTKNGNLESIVDSNFIPEMVKRAFSDDLFDPDAGIRTMSTESPTFNPNQNSYHNGSFWPMLNGSIYEGLMNWGYKKEADTLKYASLKPIDYFGQPVELYIKKDLNEYLLYRSSSDSTNGQLSCKQQAWSAAATLDLVTP